MHERTGVALTERQKISWLRLIRSDNVGPATFRDLINHFGTADAALDALPELSRRGAGARTFRVATIAEAERELEIAHRFSATFIGIGEPNYPFALRQIDGAPPLLAVKGNLNAATRSSLGVVGSRNASVSGAKFAAMIARDAGRAGYVITSGLARGIDTAAHRASLESGTIAVLAGGIDRPYPPENVGLLNDIMAGQGLAVSEMPFGWEPRARDFPRRNRSDRRHQSRRDDRRGGQPLGLTGNRPLRRRIRPPAVCRCRLSVRSAVPRNQRSAQTRRDRHDDVGRCCRHPCASQPVQASLAGRGRRARP